MRKHLLLASLVLGLCVSSPSQAATVSTVLTFDTPSSTSNRLTLALPDVSTTTDVSGTIVATLEMDINTGVIQSIELTGGSLTSSDWSMTTAALAPAVASLDLAATGSVGTGDSDSSTTVTGTSFDATEHYLLLTGGSVALNPPIAAAVDLLDTEIRGNGNGTLTSTLNGGFYDIVFSMDIDDQHDLSGLPLQITGNLVARGQVSAVPEPTSFLALASAAGAFLVRRNCKSKRESSRTAAELS
jgi:hypothetical protein